MIHYFLNLFRYDCKLVKKAEPFSPIWPDGFIIIILLLPWTREWTDSLVKFVGHNDRSALRWLNLDVKRVESERFFFKIALAFPQ